VFSEARPGREAAGTVGSKDVGNFLTFENALQIESRAAKDYCPKEQWPLKNPWADLAMGASRKNQPPTLKEVKHNSPEGSISDDDLFAPKPINSADSKEPPEPPWEPEDKPMKTGNVAWDARSALEEAEIQETMEWFKRHAVSVLSGIVEVTEEQIDHVVDMEDQLGMIPKDSQELLEWLTSSLLMKKFGENEAGGIDCPSDLIERAGERVCAHFLF
jgi:hypothetical protein